MRNYRDLLVWQEAHTLTLEIYKYTKSFPIDEKFGLTSQMRRAAASIAANLAEGCGCRSDKEMSRFIQIAMGSGADCLTICCLLVIWVSWTLNLMRF